MVGSERWQCIGMTRGGGACSRVVVFSADRLLSGHQPLCHQHLREVEEGLQREHLGSAAPSLAEGLRRCGAVGKLSKRPGRPVRQARTLPLRPWLGEPGGARPAPVRRASPEPHPGPHPPVAGGAVRGRAAAPSSGRWGWQLDARPS